MAKKERVIYYKDELNDDFASSNLKDVHLKKNYRYVNKNPIFMFFSYLIYFVLAIPLAYLISKIFFGVRVKGKKKLKALKGQGAFFYGNHTQEADAFFVQGLLSRRRTYIIAGRAAMSLKGLGWLLKMLGVIPVPETMGEHIEFMKAIEYRNKRKDHIVIYPEAHIWKYYTGIRPFTDASFSYPARLLAPVVPFVTTYRKPKIFKNAKPRMTLHVGNIIYPDASLPLKARSKALRDEAYLFMCEKAYSEDNYPYYEYVKVQPKKED